MKKLIRVIIQWLLHEGKTKMDIKYDNKKEGCVIKYEINVKDILECIDALKFNFFLEY